MIGRHDTTEAMLLSELCVAKEVGRVELFEGGSISNQAHGVFLPCMYRNARLRRRDVGLGADIHAGKQASGLTPTRIIEQSEQVDWSVDIKRNGTFADCQHGNIECAGRGNMALHALFAK
jgi:hypothetical protein